jgi:hypothetical protein
VRSSPQRRAAWLHEVRTATCMMDTNLATAQDLLREAQHILQDGSLDKADQIAKMLILDVKTRWSSTHVMLRKCIFLLARVPGTESSGAQAVHFSIKRR